MTVNNLNCQVFYCIFSRTIVEKKLRDVTEKNEGEYFVSAVGAIRVVLFSRKSL